MFKNYLVTSLRNLRKTKLFSLINGLGLAIGMAACLLILHYVTFEKSYDRFHPDSDRIYRLRYERTDSQGQAARFASCCPPAAPRIRASFPEVEKIGRLFSYRAVISHNDVKFLEERIYFAEPDVFEILKFKFIKGNPVTELKEPNRAFISQTMARKYFGSEDPIGKIISANRKVDYQVAGIFEDIPANSHLKADFWLSYRNVEILLGPDVTESWGETGFYTYLRLKPHTDMAAFKANLAKLVETDFGEALRYYKLTCELVPQPLADIHLTSHYMQEFEPNSDRDSVNYLLIIALFIIVMAWVNYINLSTARSLTRAKEVGLRKMVGASRGQLILQFFSETILINLIAVIITIILLELSSPIFNQLTGMPAGPHLWTQIWFWMVIAVMFAAGVICSGLYPVLALSSFKPVAVLHGKLGNAVKGINLRKALVIFQFVMAFILVTGTLAVFRQISYMKTQDLGIDIDQTLVLNVPRVRDESFNQKLAVFKEEISNYPDIKKNCIVTEVPGRQLIWDAGGIFRAGADEGESKNYQIMGVDYDFVDVFNLKLAFGRSFSKEFPTDEKALVLNETAVKWLGFPSSEAAVGQQVNYWGELFTVIGVMKNYHQQSLKEDFEPTIFRFMPVGRGSRGVFAMKVAPQNLQETIGRVRQLYEKLFPGNPFDYFFLDDYFNQQYKADERFGKVFGVFSGIAIFITCLGILGLSSFMTVQRTKEIGIRKVLGAGAVRIIALLTRDLFILILLSFMVALPLSVWGIHQWLKTFAVRMELGTELFLMPLLIVLLITFITVGSHVVRAACANPVKSLRYE
ncbi:MAG: ABC transporter permease [bacterium]|nr:ABC transporter permease [bacterium]